MNPSWITAFLDLTPETFDDGVRFWQEVTGYALSEPRGDHSQFATLLPPTGNAHLRVQRHPASRGRIHLDLHVARPRVAADRAVTLGGREIADLDLATSDRAAETARHEALGATVVVAREDWTVLTDPTGSAYCLTDREPL